MAMLVVKEANEKSFLVKYHQYGDDNVTCKQRIANKKCIIIKKVLTRNIPGTALCLVSNRGCAWSVSRAAMAMSYRKRRYGSWRAWELGKKYKMAWIIASSIMSILYQRIFYHFGILVKLFCLSGEGRWKGRGRNMGWVTEWNCVKAVAKRINWNG